MLVCSEIGWIDGGESYRVANKNEKKFAQFKNKL